LSGFAAREQGKTIAGDRRRYVSVLQAVALRRIAGFACE
jgi:hypothetical protein